MNTSQSGMLCRYILGVMTPGQIEHILRLAGIPGQLDRMPEIHAKLRSANTQMQVLIKKEAGLIDKIRTADTSPEMQNRINEICSDTLFKATFGDEQTQIRVVEIDNLIAPQREINIDHAEDLLERFDADTSKNSLLDFCLSTRTENEEIRTLQNSPNQMSFTSANVDMRFLGGFPKNLSEDDIEVCYVGGQPVMAVTLLLGYGAAPISAWQYKSRLVLANGFHRLYALRKKGLTTVPIVVRKIHNLEAEFPQRYLGQSREYLFKHPRPALLKDYFNPQLTGDAQIKARRKALTLSWAAEENIIPD